MTGRPPPLVLLILGLLLSPWTSLSAQLMAGVGPSFPVGGFNSEADAGVGWMASGRVGMSLLLVGIQVEGTFSRFSVAAVEDGGRPTVTRLAFGPTLAVQAIRVGAVRPYGLVGVSFGRRRIDGDASDTSWRFGYHLGAGVDFDAGPLKPFVELRYVSGDAPGSIGDSAVPILVGLRLF